MSRSKRKTPIFGMTTVISEKKDKRIWNKTFRRVAKILIKKGADIPHKKEAVSNVWDGGKDGKHYWSSFQVRDMRK